MFVPYIYGLVALLESTIKLLAISISTQGVMIWKLGRTVSVYAMVQRREKEKDSRYVQEASAPAAAPCIRCLRYKYTCNTGTEPVANDKSCMSLPV